MEFEEDTPHLDRNSANYNDIDDIKYLEFFSALKPVLRFCQICSQPAFIERINAKCTAICVTLYCVDGHQSFWHSQPKINGIYAGNLLLPASILFSGTIFTVLNEIASILRWQIMSKMAFYVIQNQYLYAAIHMVYLNYQKISHQKCLEKSVSLSRDGRCDSPETGSSSTMEKEGLIQALKEVSSYGIQIKTLTTDRHTLVKSMIGNKQISEISSIYGTSQKVLRKD